MVERLVDSQEVRVRFPVSRKRDSLKTVLQLFVPPLSEFERNFATNAGVTTFDPLVAGSSPALI
jgi:hypothetical protein